MPTDAENLPDLVRSMVEERRKRRSPQALAILERARELAAQRQAAGIDRSESMREFHENYRAILEAL
jgi:hypothetical protein